jgi:hypothetical protein
VSHAAAPAPLVLAEFDAPLPPLVVGAGAAQREVALRPIPLSIVERLQPIEEAQGSRSWPYLREILKAGAPDLTDAELDGLSINQATVLSTVLTKGVGAAMQAIARLREEEAPPGEATAGEGTSPSSAT